MDFNKATTDEILAALPRNDEDDRWELKDARKLDEKGELKKVLGKQVSAFANSGGGYLVFGISKEGRHLQPCPKLQVRQSTKDYLATLVELSVEYPIRHFNVYEIPFTDDGSKSIFVIAIYDSPAAPHQSKDDMTYYYRVDGHTKPAPHFHLELLRNRFTKAKLDVIDCEPVIQQIRKEDWGATIHIALQVKVKNTSSQCATNWGVHAKLIGESFRWTSASHDSSGQYLNDGICVHFQNSVLLPGELKTTTVPILGSAEGSKRPLSQDILLAWDTFGISLAAVSQNHIGDAHILNWNGDRAKWFPEKVKMENALKNYGIS